MKPKSETVRKGFAIFALGGIILFLVTLCGLIVVLLIFPRVLITYEYARDVRPFALAAAFLVGASLLGISFFYPRITKKNKAGRKDRFIIPLLIVIALAAGWLTYKNVGSASATVLHSRSEQESVELTAIASSAWPAHRDLLNCAYHLSFEQPRISPDVQYVCIDRNQWMFFRDVDEPIQVVLFGARSDYGYELHCCK